MTYKSLVECQNGEKIDPMVISSQRMACMDSIAGDTDDQVSGWPSMYIIYGILLDY